MTYLDLKALESALASSESVDHLITKLHAHARKPRPDVPGDYCRGLTAGLVVCANALATMFDRKAPKSAPVDRFLEEVESRRSVACAVAAEPRQPETAKEEATEEAPEPVPVAPDEPAVVTPRKCPACGRSEPVARFSVISERGWCDKCAVGEYLPPKAQGVWWQPLQRRDAANV